MSDMAHSKDPSTAHGALHGKVALVTGGTRGIGLAIVRRFLRAGAHVAISGRSAEPIAQASAQAVTGLGEQAPHCVGWPADFTQPGAPQALVNAVLERFGRLDVLVNNAGATGPVGVDAIDEAQWDALQAVNLRAAFFCARAAGAAMDRAGIAGSIVNVGSVAGQIGGAATGPAYVAAKAGMIGVTRSLARHYAPRGIRVNCVAPADIETDMIAHWTPELRQRLVAMTPLGRFGHADEVAEAAFFLATPASSYLTGHTLNLNGGLYMG